MAQELEAYSSLELIQAAGIEFQVRTMIGKLSKLHDIIAARYGDYHKEIVPTYEDVIDRINAEIDTLHRYLGRLTREVQNVGSRHRREEIRENILSDLTEYCTRLSHDFYLDRGDTNGRVR